MRIRGLWGVLPVTFVATFVMGACGGGGAGDDDDDTPGADAATSTPDADPNAPDADPNAPDADPSAPDAATGCTGGLELCGGECVDLLTDDRYCGACTVACSDGEHCVLGDCAAGVGALVISELHAQSPAYFELYNGGDAPIDLAGYQIQWNTDGLATGSVVLPAFTLQPDAFVALAEGSGAIAGDVIYLGESIGWTQYAAVRLLEPGGLGVDFVRTGASTVAPPTGTAWTGDNALNPTPTVDQSLVRNVFTADTDTAADWSLRSGGSPGDYCARPGRCGDACVDFASDRANCGGCGAGCGGTQICLDGACDAGLVGLWLSEVRRYPRAGVEVHNPTANPVAIGNYRIDITGAANLTYTFPARTLAPGAHVWVYLGDGADDGALFAGVYPALGPDTAIALYDDGTTPLDFVRFGASATPAPAGTAWFGANVPAPPMDADVGARRNLAAFDTDGPADWLLESPSTPGFTCYPGLSLCAGACTATADDPDHCGGCGIACGDHESCSSGLCTSAGGVVISELRNSGSETIELFNGTDATVDLGGWKVEWVADSGGPGSYTIPAGTMLAPGAFVLLHETSGTDSAGHLYMNMGISWTTSIAVSLLDDAASGVDFARTGDSVTMPPSGTAWLGGNAVNPANAGSETLRRQVWTPDTDGAADWDLATDTPAAYCPAGDAVCGGACADLDADPAHCGTCGNACGLGAACHAGACVELGAIRLTVVPGTDGVFTGRPDVYRENGWHGVYSVTSTAAQVICRQLGFASGAMVSDYSSTCSGCAGRIYSINCDGTEQHLLDCSFTGDTFTSVYGRVSCSGP